LDADISTLRLPTVGAIDEARFPPKGEYVYVHRKGFTALLVNVVNAWVRNGKKPTRRNILGFRRSGKSYALATFACALRSKKFNVLYIHSCSYWAAKPLEYLRAEALSAFYGFSDEQASIVNATTIGEILQILECACTQFCTNRCGCRKAGIPCRTIQLDKTPLPGQLNQRCYSFGRCYQSLGAAK
jgi:hypothetical protein